MSDVIDMDSRRRTRVYVQKPAALDITTTEDGLVYLPAAAEDCHGYGFTPKQARDLAIVLIEKAAQAEAESKGP